MISVRCPSCGHQHQAPDTEAERLRQALEEYTRRTDRTMQAQQEEIERMREALAMANATIDELWPAYGPHVTTGELMP